MTTTNRFFLVIMMVSMVFAVGCETAQHQRRGEARRERELAIREKQQERQSQIEKRRQYISNLSNGLTYDEIKENLGKASYEGSLIKGQRTRLFHDPDEPMILIFSEDDKLTEWHLNIELLDAYAKARKEVADQMAEYFRRTTPTTCVGTIVEGMVISECY